MDKQLLEKIIDVIGTHAEGENLGYCDTGEDMQRACRSECVEMAIERLRAKFTPTL